MKQCFRLSATWVLFSCVYMSVALAGERSFTPVPSESQEVRFMDGDAVLLTGQGTANLTISYLPRDKKTGWLRVWVENVGERAFNISEASLTARSHDTPLNVSTYAALVKEERRREIWSAIAAGMAAGANSYAASNAGNSSYSGTYGSHTTASAYGSGGTVYGSASTTGSFSGTAYNAGAAYQAQATANAQNIAMMDRMNASAQMIHQGLQERTLKANTVMPAHAVLGDVRFELPKKSRKIPAEFVVTVDLAGTPIQVLFRETTL